MKYNQRQFLNLIDSVEKQGGEHADVLCEDRFITEFTGDNPQIKGYESKGCDTMSIFDVPYRHEDGQEDTIRLCAVEDGLGWMPRFREDVRR